MKKERWFKISLILLPVIILAGAEIFLRIFSLYAPEPLFLSVQKNDTKYYQLNPDVAKRYFNEKQTTVPKLFPYTFKQKKDKGTIRIFCMGGSTTAGFPFDYQIPFPFQLQKILESSFPDHKFEVINMGISAINSYTVLDFLPDVLNAEPDYIVIYMGHNEFYGAYGSASNISGGSSGGLIRFYLKIKRFHLVRMFENFIDYLKGDINLNKKNETLMEQVIRDKEIKYNSKMYRSTLKNFNENLNLIVNSCKTNSIPVIVGNLVCNLRNQRPFFKEQTAGTIGKDNRDFEDIISNILSASIKNRINVITSKHKSRELNAEKFYELGQMLLTSSDFITAKFCYSKARDLDMIRFRASSDFNDIINSLDRNAVTVVNMDSVFSANAGYGIPGDDLFTDHLHPTPHGYYLMAEAFAKYISFPNIQVSGKHYPDDVEYVTDLDIEMGLIKVFKLKHRWPFTDKKFVFSDYKAIGDPVAAEYAYDYIFNHHNWYKAHYMLAQHYIDNKEIVKARKEYEAVAYYYADLADPIFKIGETYASENNWLEAEKYYLESLKKTSSKGFIYTALANAQWKQRKMVDAVNTIQYAIQAFNSNKEQQTLAKFMLANMLIDMKRPGDSKMILRDLLNDTPNYKPALSMLKQLNSK